eukprot:CAMPEP_0119111512 /NCGR_PEP_ID=MMETSP1180-20130426/35939_1 /TAXON_ID=3052 ORGANISM="Chlamydomonas cf sp, Strain CCMP681" /NCGR_SAMPLE_ID=MMETSP1180 /ASSEMBLY_ACC=CAM_ASM_000741 /LENGTH=334 /DNA_ID=CAMNT_0007098507 /DNA_START=74 /DNA_END=1078 /DNA_ORIENTATION=-
MDTAMSGALGLSQDNEQMHTCFVSSIPKLTEMSYKGQSGKIGVCGGCMWYTGAPFFAAQATHRVGADMSYVICTPEAAIPIKSFSPDMMVVPLLPAQDEAPEKWALRLDQLQPLFGRMTALVVGPGLGEDTGPQAAAAQIIRWARERNLPLVIDGSGVSTVVSNPSLVQGYKRCVITPNLAELGRLAGAVGVPLPGGGVGAQWQDAAPDIALALEGPVLVSKGPCDVITDGISTTTCTTPGSLKRCGGLGDVLAGTMGTFVSWQYPRGGVQAQDLPEDTPSSRQSSVALVAACYSACLLLRHSSKAAYEKEGRSMVAKEVLDQLRPSFVALYGP